ncbi:glycosyltransferase 87 family protein [Novosphingobium malaysiense]|uniref:Glycosyltransferase RgtA/B/C/D-like domain-containing protein n=1 Tax=Novosphingobium malaysiense TaxID=1348853 RepID=A0A0B1ZUM4_9SPHN|nr:glycosyltransferase 87 family protein [Novosphingobium malaysiense]KHK92873.1 hypothetical protein LK12_00165 [Novosphingobium malaysiense]
MIQSYFVSYWGHNHLITFVVASAFVAAALLMNRHYSIERLHAASQFNSRTAAHRLSQFIIILAAGHWLFYLLVPSFVDYGEPVMPLLAGNIPQGAPVYADWGSGEEIVGSNYGPYVFLAQIPIVLWLHSIAASKLVGIIFAAGSCVLVYLTLRKIIDSKEEKFGEPAILLALMIGFLASELHYWFWNRPDSALILTVACGIFIHERASFRKSLLAIGLLAGIATNLKLFGAIYFVPLGVACLTRNATALRKLWPAIAGAALLFAVAVALPFTLPSFNARAYVENIFMMPNQGFIIGSMVESLFFGAGILLLPFLLWLRSDRDIENTVLLLALTGCAAVTAVISGKPGGGPPYMLPFAPLSVFAAARMKPRPELNSSLNAASIRNIVLVSVLACAAPIWAYSWYQMAKPFTRLAEDRAKKAELLTLFQAYPEAEVGPSSGIQAEEDIYARVHRAFLGHTIKFDYVNYADQRLAGVPSETMLPLLSDCRVPYWIFSRSGDKFASQIDGKPIFRHHEVERFHANYVLSKKLKYYELWKCIER